jgi:hypothetical protein
MREIKTDANVYSPSIHINRAGNSPWYKAVMRNATKEPIIKMINAGAKAATE